MRDERSVASEAGAGADALEELGGLGHEAESGDAAGVKRYVSMQVFLPRKKAILVEEIRLRRMKKGQDVSRSRLISEAVDLLAERESGGKGGPRES
jgi:hypothetical protein